MGRAVAGVELGDVETEVEAVVVGNGTFPASWEGGADAFLWLSCGAGSGWAVVLPVAEGLEC